MYTVVSFTSNPNTPVCTFKFADKSAAITCLVASRFNCPGLNHVLFDGDGFIVPSSELTGWVENIRQDAMNVVDACETFLRRVHADGLPLFEEAPASEEETTPAEDGLTTFRLEGEPLSNAPGSEKLPPAPVTPPTFEKSCAGYYVADLDGTHTANLVNNRTGATPGYEWEITCNDRMTPSFNGTTKKSAVEQFNTWWKANH